jgi:cell division protein FtsQ
VQFVADTTSCGAVSLRMIPRSGDFVIAFGELNNVDDKLNKLEQFYNDGLRHLGWDKFKTIDIRYDKQVICRE